LHVLGRAPEGEELVNDVLAVLRARQVVGGKVGALPGLRSALAAHYGLDEQAVLADPRATVDVPEALGGLVGGQAATASDPVNLLEELARRLVTELARAQWRADQVDQVVSGVLAEPVRQVAEVLRFACAEVVPRLLGTTQEVANLLHALDGGFVPAGPSGSPTRGL